MKNTLILSLLVLALPLTSLAAFDVNLKYGSKGDAVIELQEFLTDQGVYSGPITGNFYSLTRSGVKKFQQVNGISPVSGYFGPLSRAKANELLNLEEDTTQEVAQTGTTTPPSNTVSPTPVQITQSPQAPAPQPQEVVLAPSVATALKIDASKSEVAGSKCEAVDYTVSVLDQYGIAMSGEGVHIVTPSYLNGATTSPSAVLRYFPISTNTEETIIFESGSLRKVLTLRTRDGLNNSTFVQSGSHWITNPDIGLYVNPDTKLCI